jgi:hypothetical protein
MIRKFAIPLATASLILAGSAFAQQPPAEQSATPRPGGPQGPMMGQGKMGHGMMGPGMMGHGIMGGHHGMMMMAPGMLQAFAEGKLAFLKSWLAITEAQTGPWNGFAEAVRTQVKNLAEQQQKWMPKPGQPEPTLPQSIDRHLQMMEDHLAAMKKVKPALDTLYQALTPEQRQKADQLLRMH